MEIKTKCEEYFAEFETDKIVRESYFSDFSYKGTMIEVGGGLPTQISMSKHFKLNGWRTIIFEPNPNYAAKHRLAGNEVYEYALSNEDVDNSTFQIVDWNNTNLSFSSIKIKDGYLKKHNLTANSLPTTEIKVNIRKLDSILPNISISNIDIVSIDTEGWELEVLQGFALDYYKPKVIVIENYLKPFGYTKVKRVNVNDYYLKD